MALTSLEQDFAVSAAWVATHGRRCRIIDVRGPAEFHGALGHIDGADRVDLDQLEAHVRSWTLDTPIVVVCRAGIRSEVGLERLEDLGFTHAVNLTGGMLAYRRVVARAELRTASVAA